MSKKILSAGLVVLRPKKDWKLEVLTFFVDRKPEFLRQAIDYTDQGAYAVLNKLKRLTGLEPSVISLEPVWSDQNVKYYCCVMRPLSRNTDLQFYETVSWNNPRSIFKSLWKKGDKDALNAALSWVDQNSDSALVMTRNEIFIK